MVNGVAVYHVGNPLYDLGLCTTNVHGAWWNSENYVDKYIDI
jgi:hypothetical protein